MHRIWFWSYTYSQELTLSPLYSQHTLAGDLAVLAPTPSRTPNPELRLSSFARWQAPGWAVVGFVSSHCLLNFHGNFTHIYKVLNLQDPTRLKGSMSTCWTTISRGRTESTCLFSVMVLLDLVSRWGKQTIQQVMCCTLCFAGTPRNTSAYPVYNCSLSSCWLGKCLAIPKELRLQTLTSHTVHVNSCFRVFLSTVMCISCVMYLNLVQMS